MHWCCQGDTGVAVDVTHGADHCELTNEHKLSPFESQMIFKQCEARDF